MAQTVLHARRLQKKAEREGRQLLRPSIEEDIRKLWSAWREGDIAETMRLAMSLQEDWCDLFFDLTWSEGIEKLVAMERAEAKKQKHTMHEILEEIWRCNGNISLAAANLDMSRQAINKRLTKKWRTLLEEGLN